MKDWLKELNERFEVRNSPRQKEAFRAYALDEAKSIGWPARTEACGESADPAKAHMNVVIGDPARARAVFTAHYDTPRRALIPNLMLPLNPVLRYLVIFVPMFAMLALSVWAARAVQVLSGLEGTAGRFLYLAVYAALYFGLFLLLYRGKANLHNANDNTSGTACVLALAEKLKGDERAAFILFDNEEKGKKGSKAWAKAHADFKSGLLLVNLDCVGNGENFIVSASPKAMEDGRFEALAGALEGLGAKVYNARRASMNSDQKNFDLGVGVCACLRSRFAGYYTPRIHTGRDTVANAENIARLSDALAGFVQEL